MNADVFGYLSLIGITAACIGVPPLVAGLFDGVVHHFAAKKQGRAVPSLFQVFHEMAAAFKAAPAEASKVHTACVLLSMAFHLVALVMLGLQRDLPPILFLHAFGLLALILGGMTRTRPYYGLNLTCELREIFTSQPVLLLSAVGIFFATGSFNPAAVTEYPRMLVVDLPLLCLAVLLVEQHRRNVAKDETPDADPALAIVKLANCYRSATVLLFAGFFFSHSLTGASIVAVLLHIVLRYSYQASAYLPAPVKAAWSWGYVLWGCSLNLIWVYLKYWM